MLSGFNDYYDKSFDVDMPDTTTAAVTDIKVYCGDTRVDVEFRFCLEDADAVAYLRRCLIKAARTRLQRQLVASPAARRATYRVDLRTFNAFYRDWTADVTVRFWNADGASVADVVALKGVALPMCPYILVVGHSGAVAHAA